MRSAFQPGSAGLPENPKPGSDGATTWKASCASPPCAVGSVNGSMILKNSMTEPGQPCVMTIGRASACGERTCRKWMSRPSISVRYCAKPFSIASKRRQS